MHVRALLGLSLWLSPLLCFGPACSSGHGTSGTGAGGSGGAACAATHLFGIPNDKTGLDDAQCSPSCGCGKVLWAPEPWTEERVAALLAWTPVDGPTDLLADPYTTAPPDAPPGQVCGFVVDDLPARTYRLKTFATEVDAAMAGAVVTHADACGLCSTLHDLAVYASIPDLTAPVRQCGVDSFSTGLDADIACLEGLGFTHPCAQVWAYNTQHTRTECLATCFALLGDPYQKPDGSLNDCLLCDEEKSGPVFKAVAGRTRRNTGVPSALCRPCDQVARLDHAYPR